MVQSEGSDFVERNEDGQEKRFVLLLEGDGEPVDNAAEDLQELRHAVVVLCLVDKLQGGDDE